MSLGLIFGQGNEITIFRRFLIKERQTIMARLWNIRIVLQFSVFTIILFHKVHAQCSATDKTATENINSTFSMQTITNPGEHTYLPSLNCKWIIDSGPSGDRILLTLKYYYIEAGPGCSYDSLKIFDGNTLTSTVLATLCGNQQDATETYTSSGRYLMLNFKSDFSVEYGGFEATYNSGTDQSGTGCSAPEELRANMSDAGYLSSPGFPGAVTPGAACSWIIRPSNSINNVTVQLLFSDINDGTSSSCTESDVLKIYEGTDSSGTLLASFCSGRKIFPSEQTTIVGFRELYISYSGQRSGSHGFYLQFDETLSGFTTPAPPVITQAPNVESGCGTHTLTASSAVQYLTSPSYPIFYTNNLDCSWLISAPTGYDIQINFQDFFTELSDGCTTDVLIIYDGDTTEFPVIGRFCGEYFADVNSTSNKLLLTFTTDESYTERGFELTFAVIAHDTPACVDESVTTTNLNASSTIQYITSPGYPSNYANLFKAQWLIYNPTEDNDIILKVEDSRIEAVKHCIYDKVEVYKGPCTSYPLLGTFCGVSEPTYYQDAGKYVLIVFTTDINVQFRGFNISYVLGDAPTSLPLALIIGLIVGPIFAIIILIAVICFIVKAHRTYKKKQKIARIADSKLSSGEPQPGSSTSYASTLKLPPVPVKLPPIDADLLYNTKNLKLPPIPSKSKSGKYSKLKNQD